MIFYCFLDNEVKLEVRNQPSSGFMTKKKTMKSVFSFQGILSSDSDSNDESQLPVGHRIRPAGKPVTKPNPVVGLTNSGTKLCSDSEDDEEIKAAISSKECVEDSVLSTKRISESPEFAVRFSGGTGRNSSEMYDYTVLKNRESIASMTFDLDQLGEPLVESTRIHRRSSITYQQIVGLDKIPHNGDIDDTDKELQGIKLGADDEKGTGDQLEAIHEEDEKFVTAIEVLDETTSCETESKSSKELHMNDLNQNKHNKSVVKKASLKNILVFSDSSDSENDTVEVVDAYTQTDIVHILKEEDLQAENCYNQDTVVDEKQSTTNEMVFSKIKLKGTDESNSSKSNNSELLSQPNKDPVDGQYSNQLKGFPTIKPFDNETIEVYEVDTTTNPYKECTKINFPDGYNLDRNEKKTYLKTQDNEHDFYDTQTHIASSSCEIEKMYTDSTTGFFDKEDLNHEQMSIKERIEGGTEELKTLSENGFEEPDHECSNSDTSEYEVVDVGTQTDSVEDTEGFGLMSPVSINQGWSGREYTDTSDSSINGGMAFKEIKENSVHDAIDSVKHKTNREQFENEVETSSSDSCKSEYSSDQKKFQKTSSGKDVEISFAALSSQNQSLCEARHDHENKDAVKLDVTQQSWR